MSKTKRYISLIIRMVVALIYLQTLYFKFTAHPDSVYIFTKLGVEPYGRIGLGILELITGILILIPKTATYGMLGGLVLIIGALASHLGPLGIEILGDGGKLFFQALYTFALILIWLALNFKKVRGLWPKHRS